MSYFQPENKANGFNMFVGEVYHLASSSAETSIYDLESLMGALGDIPCHVLRKHSQAIDSLHTKITKLAKRAKYGPEGMGTEVVYKISELACMMENITAANTEDEIHHLALAAQGDIQFICDEAQNLQRCIMEREDD